MWYKIKVEVPHQADPAVVFDLVTTTATWLDWSLADEAELVREGVTDPEGVGALRRFRTGRSKVREEIVAYDRPHHTAYTLLDGLPLRDYRADVWIDATSIRWESRFKPRYPGTGLIYKVALGVFIRRTATRLAAHAAASRRV